MSGKEQRANLTMWGYGVEYFTGGSIGIPRDQRPVRTVFNPTTQQHEEIPLARFQHLLRQGKIEETEGQSPYDGQSQRIYRLI
jgi:hypothetical protein